MSLENQKDPNRHSLKAKLYENNMDNAKGKYHARTVTEGRLEIEDIVTDMIKLDDYPGTREQALACINSYYRTRNFRLMDGYAVSNGWTTSYFHLGGSFDGPNDPIDKDKHKITLRTVAQKALKEAIQKEMKAEVLEVAHNTGDVHYLDDLEASDLPNNFFEPGNMIIIVGEKIKIAGDHKDNGVYFISKADPAIRVKMTRIAFNYPNSIMGIAPNTSSVENYIEIRTQYSSGTLRDDPRVITCKFIMSAM